MGTDVRPLAPRVTTSWTFTSQPPAGAKPAGYTCPQSSSTAGCAFQPLLQLRYRLGLDGLNSAAAGDRFTFELGVGAHRRTPSPARVSGVRVWASTDDGATWQEARVQPSGQGRFTVRLEHPALDRTNGFVWLRAEAWDAAGNRVEQIIERAYALR